MAGIALLNNIKSLFKSKPEIPEPEASGFFGSEYSGYRSLYFDGEKTPYELGPAIDYKLDYYTLRARAWQAYIESDVIQNAIKKYCLWIVGAGLKLQAQPQENILKGIELGPFIEDVESRFRLFVNENFSTYNGMQSINDQASEALQNALNAGDVLCVNRFNGSNTTLEIIDGVHVRTPMDDKIHREVQRRGNTMRDGVEIGTTGKHVAYYVTKGGEAWQRIPATGPKTGRLQAWLFYGMKHKIGDVRGMSLLTAVLETAAKMDRYKDATLGSAEENAKIPYTIEHKDYSTGEDITTNQIAQSFGKGKGIAPETDSYIACEAGGVASKVAQTTSKTTYNMPIGSSLVRNPGSSDINFSGFFTPNIEIIYATIGIPPEIALDKFGGAYSGSRAALKSWEYKMFVDRVKLLKNQYYKPFYNYWLDINVLSNAIQAPGYLEALSTKNLMFLAAYRNARFIGVTVPHIDPLKEVNAERAKLGIQFDNIPLTTLEQAAENLNTGDADQIIKKAQNEKESAIYFDSVNVSDPNSTESSQVPG